MAELNQLIKEGDVIVREIDQSISREKLTVLDGQTLVTGQIAGLNAAGKVVSIATLLDDIYTITEQAGTDGGTFALRYRGEETAPLAFDITNADLQTAVRALHGDLDSAVAAGAAAGPYTITVPNEKKSDRFHLSKGADSTADGGVIEGGIIVDLTTVGEHPSLILLDASAPSGSDLEAPCLVRSAVVDDANLTGGSADVFKRLAESKVADSNGNAAGFGMIIARSGPTFTQLNP